MPVAASSPPIAATMRRGDVVECCVVSDLPTPKVSRDPRYRVAPLPPKITPATLAVVAERTAADPGSGVSECPAAGFLRLRPPVEHRDSREIADSTTVIMGSFDTHLTSSQANPQRCV
ncbi:hypothetical protein [Rhodococcus sp. OK302]|uniref:hypothetical protein n=1 Tax=Rhodococcus sp. OK302 TaxID=1882769 RepID=UPI0011402659|nr:hypothetical protein [Rhodococcus sp. OK302]